MKKIVVIALMLIMSGECLCQEVIHYPYSCYMEWPMPLPMDSTYHRECNHVNLDRTNIQWMAFSVLTRAQFITHAREFEVDTPTTIYGIAITLWGQDTARRDFNVMLYNRIKGSDNVALVRKMRWRDSLPVRHIVFEAGCGSPDGNTYIDTAIAYEFYFDTPVVVYDTFYVGYHTLGVDGLQHQHETYFRTDSTGYVHLITKQVLCPLFEFPHPCWYRIINDTRLVPPIDPICLSDWAGLLPIIEAPCSPDTLTCAPVPDMGVVPLDSLRVEFSWPTLPEQQGFQISVGLQGTPPEAGRLYDVSASPFVLTDNWDTTATYVAYIRARREIICHPYDTLVWSDWSVPIHFFGYQSQNPTGINMPDSRTSLFTLTPNPAYNSVTISSRTAKATVSLRDASGRELLSLPFTAPRLTIPLQDYPAGTYFITLSTPEGKGTKRLVVE